MTESRALEVVGIDGKVNGAGTWNLKDELELPAQELQSRHWSGGVTPVYLADGRRRT